MNVADRMSHRRRVQSFEATDQRVGGGIQVTNREGWVGWGEMCVMDLSWPVRIWRGASLRERSQIYAVGRGRATYLADLLGGGEEPVSGGVPDGVQGDT